MSSSSSFSCRGEWGGGGGRGRPGLVMNALTITHFKSRVYPWGMEKLVHRLGGNCLFLWPAAKGEEVNGKWYESVCPLRWWIRCKLEEEAFWSWALWLFLFLPLKIVFCLLLHSPFPAFVSFFGIFPCFFSIFFFYLLHLSSLHGARVMRVCGLTGWALGGQESKGSICRLWDRKLRQHGLQWEHSVQQESRGRAESQRTVTLSREQRRNWLKSIESDTETQAFLPSKCVHTWPYGILLKMD